MLAVDTNVLVRLAIADDAQQVARAAAALREQRFYVSLTVLLETEWVLRSAAGLDRAAVKRTLERIIQQEHAVIERRDVALRALDDFSNGIDFTDALHLRGASDCVAFLTFDRKLARRADRLDGLSVREP